MAWMSSGSSNAALVANLTSHRVITSDRVRNAMMNVRQRFLDPYTRPRHLDPNLCYLQVDRGHYAPALPYQDSPQPIGFSATISAPHSMYISKLLPPSVYCSQNIRSRLGNLKSHVFPETCCNSKDIVRLGDTNSEFSTVHAAAAESLLPFLYPGAKVLDVGSGSGYLTHVLSNLVGSEGGGKVIGIDHIQGLVDLATKNMGKSADGYVVFRYLSRLYLLRKE